MKRTIKAAMKANGWRSMHAATRSLDWMAQNRPAHQRVAEQIGSLKAGSKTLPKEKYDTIIIGGGCAGVSIAYHLAKAGVKDILLLEKSELTAGSTWHAAGLTTYYHPGINPRRIHFYSLNLFKELENETGQAVGLHTPGSIRIATTPQRMDEFNYQMSRHVHQEAEQYMLTPEQIHHRHPLVNMDGILGGLWTSGDGHIDPYSLTMALAKGARMYGATIAMPVTVEKLTQRSDGGWNVDTNNGKLQANRVVNAAGFWAEQIGRMAGVELPLVTVQHQYVVTESVPEVQALSHELPVLRDLEGSYYLRQERDGILIGPYEEESKMKVQMDWVYGDVPNGFGKELFESDVERIADNLAMAMNRVPCLQNTGIQNVTCGPISYSPDVYPLLGPWPGLRNFWCANGFSYGIVHSGGIGKYVADWMVDGEPPYDLTEFDPARYGAWATKHYVVAKARESYGLNNVHNYPHTVEERPAGRPARTNAIYYRLKARGAEFSMHNGWEQPSWFALDGDEPGYKPSWGHTNTFEPVLRECHTVLNKVGIIDLTPFSKYEIYGADAAAFLDRMCANTLPAVGRGNVSHMLTPKGRVMAELSVIRLAADKFYVITGSGSELHDLRWLSDHIASSEDVRIDNVTGHYAVLGVAGPQARNLLQKLCYADMSAKSFPFFGFKNIEIAGIPVRAVRVSYSGELGWELHHRMEFNAALYARLLEAGEEFGVGDFGTLAMNALRIEKGYRMWGADMNKDTTPLNAGLDFFVKHKSAKKGDFIGKAALLEQEKSGLQRRLVMLEIDSKDYIPHGDECVFDGTGDNIAGNVTSGCFSPTLGKPVSFAYVPAMAVDPGTLYKVLMMGVKYNARVVEQPIQQPEHVRSRPNRGT